MLASSGRSFGQVFWDAVEKSDGCWLWKRSRDLEGYGRLRVLGTFLKAHRVAYELSTGQDPAGLVVCHTCDNPPCCNPAHLFLGTVADNQRDMVEKGRGRNGEHNGRAKITREIADAIRAAYAAGGVTQQALAFRYGINQSHVSAIIRGANWIDHGRL